MASSTPEDQFPNRQTHHAVTASPPASATTTVRPHVWEFVLHPMKALRFVGALTRDANISLLRKILYVTVVGLLLVALLVPEGIVAAIVATLLPVAGPLVAVPADAAVDWLLVGTAAYALLGLFPARVVREQHARIFHPRRRN